MMNTKTLGLACLASLASTLTFAETKPTLPFGLTFSGSAALTTDYRFRGITQTENDPALQASFQLDHASGVYAGVWGSNVNFGEGDNAHLELDPYIGYTTTLDNVMGKPTFDAGVYYYAYPSSHDLNFVEYYVGLGFSDLVTANDSLSTTINYTNDYLGLSKDSWYFALGYTIPFADTGFSGLANIGYTTVNDNYYFNEETEQKHYWDWKAGISYDFKSIDGFTAELSAVGTNIDKNGFEHQQKRAVDTGAVFTLSKAF